MRSFGRSGAVPSMHDITKTASDVDCEQTLDHDMLVSVNYRNDSVTQDGMTELTT